MNLALFYDTETTGLPDFKEPSEAPQQPHIVQLAAILADLDTGKEIASMDVVIQPQGWVIPDEMALIHGITTQYANEVGIPEKLAVQLFMEFAVGRKRIAHNQQFDARIIRIALKRFSTEAVADEFKAGVSECTAVLSTPICNLPPTDKMLAAGMTKNKTPNLGEAYRHFIGRDFVGAHTAMADVRACMAVYFAIKEKNHV
jgi:DNA polymerase III subunit epsilon